MADEKIATKRSSSLFMDEDWWYETSRYNCSRFVLGQPGQKTLVCFGINPSTATPEKLDNTIKRVQWFAKKLCYDGWMMLNIYPLRATNPDDLPGNCDNLLFAMNRSYIFQTLEKLPAASFWAAWGTLIEKRPYLAECLLSLNEDVRMSFPCPDWITIGERSQAGHPHHPLYLPHDAKVEQFDIDEYVKGLANGGGVVEGSASEGVARQES